MIDPGLDDPFIALFKVRLVAQDDRAWRGGAPFFVSEKGDFIQANFYPVFVVEPVLLDGSIVHKGAVEASEIRQDISGRRPCDLGVFARYGVVRKDNVIVLASSKGDLLFEKGLAVNPSLTRRDEESRHDVLMGCSCTGVPCRGRREEVMNHHNQFPFLSQRLFTGNPSLERMW